MRKAASGYGFIHSKSSKQNAPWWNVQHNAVHSRQWKVDILFERRLFFESSLDVLLTSKDCTLKMITEKEYGEGYAVVYCFHELGNGIYQVWQAEFLRGLKDIWWRQVFTPGDQVCLQGCVSLHARTQLSESFGVVLSWVCHVIKAVQCWYG